MFREARQGALLELVVVLLAMMCSINDFFDCTDALKVPGHAHLYKGIHSLLKMWELALALKSKGAIALNVQLKRSLQWGERSWWQQNKGKGSDVGVIMMILLILASSLSAALLFAVLAIAR
jgi:hypothetical protein